MENLVKIGHTQKPHGLAGELKVFVEEMYEEDFLNRDTVFLNIKGKQLPYFVESVRGGNYVIVKFEDVDTKEQAMAIQSKELCLRQADLLMPDERMVTFAEGFAYLEGFMLLDKNAGQVAEIEQIVEMPQREMAVVTYKKREVMIPLHQSFIVSIDKNKKEILMELPDGLLDL